MREVQKGRYYGQELGGKAKSSRPLEQEYRLDWSLRLWAVGRDEEEWQYSGESAEAYNKNIQRPRGVWRRAAEERPAFALAKGGSTRAYSERMGGLW